MEFVKYPSTESFSHVCRTMARKMFPTPTHYGAKVKLHGTNAGVRMGADGSVRAQSRSRDIVVGDDNYGFAGWLAGCVDAFSIPSWLVVSEHLTIFGEWAGKGIQNTDAVTQLDRKYFFVFAAQVDDKMLTDPEILQQLVPDLDEIIVLPWHTLMRNPFDWTNAAELNVAVEEINEAVEEIGKCDPFIKSVFEIEGPGEGLVFMPPTGWNGVPRDTYSELLFKAKTEAHRTKKSGKAATPRMETPQEVFDFVEMFVTEARLKQGLEEACDGIAEKPRTGAFLKWMGQDVQKESVAELEDSGLEWKQVAGMVNKASAQWFLTKCMEPV